MYTHFMNKSPCPISIYFSLTGHDEIVQIIREMKKKKIFEIDQLNPDFIKQINTNIATPLAIIANNSMEI